MPSQANAPSLTGARRGDSGQRSLQIKPELFNIPVIFKEFPPLHLTVGRNALILIPHKQLGNF